MREMTNDESLDMFAEMLEPMSVILADKEVAEKFKSGTLAAGVAHAIRKHKPEVIQILAATDGEPVETYKVNPIAIPFKLLHLFSAPEMKELFMFAGQKNESASSGSAMENTEGGEH